MWTTKEGEDIEYKDLKDSHLLNIIKWVEDKAENGMTLVVGSGGWDIDDMSYDEEVIEGDEVLEHYNYRELLKEAKKRKLI